MMTKKTAQILSKAFLLLFVLALVALEILFRMPNAPVEIDEQLYSTLSRFIGGAVCIVFMAEFSLCSVMKPLGNQKLWGIVLALPAFAVAVNNFPFVSFLSGDCRLDASAGDIFAYALFCLSVGFFEEMAFRGCTLMFLMKKRAETKKGIFFAIFLSSVAFGAVHLINLFTSSPGAVFLQIGYSALIGALCSVVLLETGNIWCCILLHSVYNFCGGVVPAFGSGTIWTAEEVALTAVLAVVVTLYSIWRFIKMPISNASGLYLKKQA